MSEATLDILRGLFGIGIFASPLISFFIVRKKSWDRNLKIGLGILIAILLSIACYVLVMLMAYRVGIFK